MTKLCKVGGSIKVTIPAQIFKILGWETDDNVSVKMLDNGKMLIVNIDFEKRQGNEKKDFFKP